MDGRMWTRWAAAGLLAAAVGCSSTPKTASGMTAQLPGQGESRWAKLFGPKPPGPLPPPPAEVVASGGKKKGISPETQITFAKTHMEAAFLEDQTRSDELLDAARQRFQAVLQKDPKNAEALRGLGELYTRARDRDKAVAAYQALVKAHPKDHKAAHEMALSCASFDEWVAATGAVEYALSLDPENRRYQKTYGKCLAWAGQPDRALEVLAKVMPEAEARYTLAKVLVEGQQVDLGRQQLRLAVQADPSFAPAKEALAQLEGGPQPTQAAAAEADGATPAVVQTTYQQPQPEPQPQPQPGNN